MENNKNYSSISIPMMESNDARLETSINKRDWDTLLTILKPKFFPRAETGKLASPRILAKIAETLTDSSPELPDKVQIVFVKCLMNSCVNGYEHREYEVQGSPSKPNDNFYAFLYENCANDSIGSSTDKHGYPIFTHFPYDGVAKHVVDYVLEFLIDLENLSEDKLELLRLGVQFLCNLCKSKIPYVRDKRLKKVTMRLVRHDHLPVLRAASAFIYNTLTLFDEDYYTDVEKSELIASLIEPVKLGIPSAIDALKRLSRNTESLENAYKEMQVEDRLYLLEVFHQELREGGSPSESLKFSPELVSFLSKCFKRKSDLVLKTVNTYLNGTEPMEIMILLDILGALTSVTSKDQNFVDNLQGDKSLLINCIYLLKSLHMVGKQSDNFFTPVQKLNELAPAGHKNENGNEKSDDIQSHPAFGFKAGLIRVIGNMAHQHKGNQDMLREEDGIPLLLDCCNMDARNPLILQWTILAMRNVCEKNTANQDVVRGLNKVGVADSAVLREMGVVLHDEGSGKAVGIVPLNRN